MFLRITASEPELEPHVTLHEADDFRRLHVEVVGLDNGSLEKVIRTHDLGHVAADSDQIHLSVVTLRALAGEQSPQWHNEFSAMLTYARAQGWMPDEDYVRAHCVRA